MDDTKILICCDKFKGSLDAHKVCKSISDGLVSFDSNLQVNIQPMADGGDGSLSVLKEQLQLEAITTESVDPLGRTITAAYHICLLYTSPSPRDKRQSRMPSSA